MSDEPRPPRSPLSWQDVASAWIVSAVLLAGLVIATTLGPDARHSTASYEALSAPVTNGAKVAEVPGQ